MSDWSTAWAGAREGLAHGASLAEQRRARQAQEEFERQRVGYEGERLGLEKSRAQREAEAADIAKKIAEERFKRMITPPDTSGTVVTGSVETPEGWQVTRGWDPSKMEVSDIPGSTQKAVRIGGQVHFVPKNFFENFPGIGGKIGAPGVPSAPPTAPAKDPNDMLGVPDLAPKFTPLEPPALPTGGPASSEGQTISPTGQEEPIRKYVIKGFHENGLPSYGVVYEAGVPTPVRIKDPIGGRDVLMLRTFDPATGSKVYHPHPADSESVKLTERQNAVGDSLTALQHLDELEEAIHKYGTFEKVDPRGQSLLNSLPNQIVMATARAMNPGYAPSEAQIEADRESILPNIGAHTLRGGVMSMATRPEVALESIKNLRHNFVQNLKNRGLDKDVLAHMSQQKNTPFKGIFAAPQEVEAAAAKGQIKENDWVLVGGMPAKWNSK